MSGPVAGRATSSPGLRSWAAALQGVGAIPLLIALGDFLRYEARQPGSSFLTAIETAGFGFVLALIGIPLYALGYTLGLIHYFRRSTIPTRFDSLLLALPMIVAASFVIASAILRWRR